MSLKKHKTEIFLLLILTLFSFFVRFSGLEDPGGIISDEGYFVSFARSYLDHTFYHGAHPPLGKMFIALGIKIFGNNPFGWRFFTALFGSLLIPLAYFLARKLFKKIFIAFSFSFLLLFDGMFFVQSRLARLDVMYLFFILLCFLLFFYYLSTHNIKRAHLFLLFSGVSFGLSFSVKWVALATIFPILILYLSQRNFFKKLWINKYIKNFFSGSVNIHPGYFILYFIIIPFSLYFLVWQIHYGLINTAPITWHENFKMFAYHESIKEIHTYGSAFWSWPLLIQPFPYFLEKLKNGTRVITDLGNPLIWWPALIGLFLVIKRWLFRKIKINFLFLCFLCYFLPFIFISRSLFLYHFMPAALFLWLIFAYLLYKSWQKNKTKKAVIVAYFILVIISFYFFLPTWTGQEITENGLHLRAWLPAWFSFVK